MKCLTVSDEVVPIVYSLNAQQRFRGVQLALGCGDLPVYYLEFLVTTLAIPCYYIHGNHDKPEITAGGEVIPEPRGCTSVEGSSVSHCGLLIAGLGGSIRYNDEAEYQYTEREMALRAWRLAPRLLFNRARYGRYLDVLLTHAPPLDIHNGPDLPHRGFRVFLRLMERFQPRYLIHGHIHLSYGFGDVSESRYENTTIINTSGYRLLTIEPPTAGDNTGE